MYLLRAAQLLFSIFNDFIGFHVSTGLLLFLLNIPVLILGWLKVGRSFTIYSIISVVAASLFLQFLPVLSISDDILLNFFFVGVFFLFVVCILFKIFLFHC